MKKFLALLLAGVVVLSMVACGKPAAKPDSTDEPAGNQQTEGGSNVQVNPVELNFYPATTENYATIKINESIKMDDSSAWFGLCPTGKDYITELEADEVDVIWWGMEPKEDIQVGPSVFACDMTDVEDGTYAAVVATSDDENVGYVVIQLEMTKKGDKLTFDYTNAKLNERPEK